jgi:C1A family cysteine protease
MGVHAMLLVGYDRGKRFFLFKNSWDRDRGEDGFVKLSYDYVRMWGYSAIAVSGVSGVSGPGL